MWPNLKRNEILRNEIGQKVEGNSRERRNFSYQGERRVRVGFTIISNNKKFHPKKLSYQEKILGCGSLNTLTIMIFLPRSCFIGEFKILTS